MLRLDCCQRAGFRALSGVAVVFVIVFNVNINSFAVYYHESNS